MREKNREEVEKREKERRLWTRETETEEWEERDCNWEREEGEKKRKRVERDCEWESEQ